MPDTNSSLEPAVIDTALVDLLGRNAPFGFALIDRDLRYLRLNESLAAVNGFTVEEHLGRTVRELLPSLADFLEPQLRQVIETGQTLVLDNAGTVQSDETLERHWIAQYVPMIDSSGEVWGVAAFLVDTTALVHARQERDRTRSQLQALVQQMPSGVIVAECPDGRIVLYNAQAERILGHPLLPADDVEEYRQYRGFHLDGRPYQPREYPTARTLLDGEIVSDEQMRYLRDNGVLIDISVSSSPVIAAGERFAAVTTFHDISPLKQALQERDRLLQQQTRIAATLQRSLLVLPADDYFDGLLVHSHYEAAGQDAEVGGDFVDVFPVHESLIALVVGDVSGKGLDAAARTAECKYALRAFLRSSRNPSQAIADLNHYLCAGARWERNPITAFTCLTLCVLDTRTGTLQVVVAGMDPPVIVRHEGGAEGIDSGGAVLGVLEDTEYVKADAMLQPGDTLFLCSDGITEAREDGVLLEWDGFRRLAAEAASAPTLSASLERIVEGARTAGGGELSDDICLIAARYTGSR